MNQADNKALLMVNESKIVCHFDKIYYNMGHLRT